MRNRCGRSAEEEVRKKCERSAEEVRKKCGRSADEVRNAAEEVRTKCGTLRRKCGTAAEAAKKEEDERPCERHFFWLLADYCPRAPRQREVNSRNTRNGARTQTAPPPSAPRAPALRPALPPRARRASHGDGRARRPPVRVASDAALHGRAVEEGAHSNARSARKDRDRE